ncbi:MAG: alpha/beta fold hydrolase, partial [Hyphomicrobium sp.]
MASTLLKAVIALAGLYALVVVATYYLQRKLLYFPDTRRMTPESLGLAGVQEIEIRTPDGETVVAWYGAAQPGQPTLLYYHGNAGSLANRSERFAKYLARGRGMLMMTYRGYGGSSGKPSEAVNVADAALAYERLRGMGVAAEDIILYGESLGSGVAVQIAARHTVGGIVLDAPYTSIVDVAEQVYPILPARWLMTDRYETMRHLPG